MNGTNPQEPRPARHACTHAARLLLLSTVWLTPGRGLAQPTEGETPSPGCEALQSRQMAAWEEANGGEVPVPGSLSWEEEHLAERGAELLFCHPAFDGAWGFLVDELVPAEDTTRARAFPMFCDVAGECQTGRALELQISPNTDFASDQTLESLSSGDIDLDDQSNFLFRVVTNNDGPLSYDTHLLGLSEDGIVDVTLDDEWLQTANLIRTGDINADGFSDIAFRIGQSYLEPVHGPLAYIRGFPFWALGQPGGGFEVDTPFTRKLAQRACLEAESGEGMWYEERDAIALLCARLGFGEVEPWDLWDQFVAYCGLTRAYRPSSEECEFAVNAVWPWMVLPLPFEVSATPSDEPCQQWAHWLREALHGTASAALGWHNQRRRGFDVTACRSDRGLAWGLVPTRLDTDTRSDVAEYAVVVCRAGGCEAINTVEGFGPSRPSLTTFDLEGDGDGDLFVGLERYPTPYHAFLYVSNADGVEAVSFDAVHPALRNDNVLGLLDYDEDGLMDITWMQEQQVALVDSRPVPVQGPIYLAHALGDGSFSVDDDVALLWLEEQCGRHHYGRTINSAVIQLRCAQHLGGNDAALFDELTVACEAGSGADYCSGLDRVAEWRSRALPFDRPQED